MTATLDVPPSANHLWRIAGRKLVRTERYVNWIAANEYALLPLRRPYRYPVAVTLVIRGGRGWRANRDGDNAIKPLVDLLTHARVIAGDTTAHVGEITLRYVPPAGRDAVASVEVSVCELEGASDGG